MNRIYILIAALVLAVIPSTGQSVYSFSMPDDEGGWLGVVVQDITTQARKNKELTVSSGALVSEVVEDSPAEAAGILKNDVITGFNGKTIEESDELIRAVRKSEPETEVKVEVNRKGESKTFTVTLDKRRESTDLLFRHMEPFVAAPHPFMMEWRGAGGLNGLEVQDLSRQLAEYFEVPGNRGVLVTEVRKNSTAQKAGFRAGDVIVRVNNNTILDIDDLHSEISDADTGLTPFDVIRKGKPLTLKMKVNVHNGDDDDVTMQFRGDIPGMCPMGPYQHSEGIQRLREQLRELAAKIQEKAMHIRDKIQKEILDL